MSADLPEPEAPPKEAANFSGVVKRFDKRTRAHENGMSMGWVKRTYADAVEYTRTGTGARGLAFFWVCVSALMLGAFCVYGLITAAEFDVWFGYVGIVVLLGMMFVSVVVIPLWGIRLELFAPEDLPVIFDRKHRKVYRITRYTQSGLKGLFKPWPTVALEYDWDLVDAELHVQTAVGPNVAKRQHSLWFVVRRSAEDDTPIDAFTLGNSLVFNEGLASAFYEHIRRFMEEGGQHVVRGEPLAVVGRPETMWEGVKQAAHYKGGGFRQWFRDGSLIPWMVILLFPVFGPMIFLSGIGNYLAYKTSMPVQWPREVLDAVGEPLAGQA
ncbi:DUF6708 domain-containing protein [Denitromonas halophila]|uniref:DUF6708 domain-containing protein n=1 Tax=Denitromonas halophila TaxID=1629404 RepID=A0A557R0Y1_9RHOO|nr:DUF6708 domain-containing protein [Denitromonas halophila]TVO58815.1 hypothetical protein FHP91_03890 [Denitromonas halophila]